MMGPALIRPLRLGALSAALLILVPWVAHADQFHYQNFLIGDRAIGLGGAYAGVSDDASGVFYNPAGTAFALNNDISGSANAIYSRKLVFKETIGGRDFTEESGGTVPSFFGGLLKLDSVAKGLVMAWGIYSLDSELKDQDDLYEDIILGPNSACPIATTADTSDFGTIPAGSENAVLKRFHRTVNARGATEFMGASLGWRVTNSFAIGGGLNYVKVDELIQEYQDVKQSANICSTDGTLNPGTRLLTQNIRQRLVAYGIQPVVAAQLALDKLSIGFTAKFGSYLSQSFERTLELRTLKLLNSTQQAVDATESAVIPSGGLPFAEIAQAETSKKFEKPLGSMPAQMRLGFAYFANTRLLLTLDVTHSTAVTDADSEEAVFGGKTVEVEIYGKEAVTNAMAGVEYYLVPAVPLRLGLFTNNDARPKISEGDVYRRNHVDYMGGSIFLAWVQPNSQIGAGIILQNGSGKAQKIGGSTAIQDVDASSFTFAFSATTTL